MLLVAIKNLACNVQGDWSSIDKLRALASQCARNMFFTLLKTPIILNSIIIIISSDIIRYHYYYYLIVWGACALVHPPLDSPLGPGVCM